MRLTRGATCVVGGRVGMDETHQVNIHFNWDNLSFFLLPSSFILLSSSFFLLPSSFVFLVISTATVLPVVLVLVFIFVFVVGFCCCGLLQLPFPRCSCFCFFFVFRLSSQVSCSSAVCWSCVQMALLASALRVLPAETRLTVYRRL